VDVSGSANTEQPLTGRVALVAGATRGAGRAIAIELGAAGATVYATGRSTRGNPSPMARAETIEETAELIDAAGGRGIAVRCDHTSSDEVAALAAGSPASRTGAGTSSSTTSGAATRSRSGGRSGSTTSPTASRSSAPASTRT
jgi:NAD(P)-dependent dehydrogenase (short-subunit alcohol dehydrogenase family)